MDEHLHRLFCLSSVERGQPDPFPEVGWSGVLAALFFTFYVIQLVVAFCAAVILVRSGHLVGYGLAATEAMATGFGACLVLYWTSEPA